MTDNCSYRDFSEAEKKKLWRQLAAGDEKGRSLLLESNYPLVRMIASRFAFDGEMREDLFQAGVIGLILAVKGFDYDRGVAFSVYAFPYIKGEVIKALAQIRGEKKESRLRTAKELARKDLPAAVVAAKAHLSLEELVEMTESVVFSDDSAAAMFEQIENQLLIKKIVEKLEPQDRLLLYCRYYLKKSQAETGEIFHLSQGRISRKEKEILSKLRRIAAM